MEVEKIIENLKSRNHKPDVNKEDWHKVKLNLLKLAQAHCDFCDAHKIEVVFTSIIRGRLPQSVSDSHAEGRAFDASVRGFTTDEMDELVKEINDKYANEIGAISFTDKKARAVIAHASPANHLHYQIRSNQ